MFNKFKEWRRAEEEADKKYQEFQEAINKHRDEFYEYLYEKNKKGEIKVDWL